MDLNGFFTQQWYRGEMPSLYIFTYARKCWMISAHHSDNFSQTLFRALTHTAATLRVFSDQSAAHLKLTKTQNVSESDLSVKCTFENFHEISRVDDIYY